MGLLDLAKLTTRPDEEVYEISQRFARMIQVQRQDFAGRVLTIRAADHPALATILDVPVADLGECLDTLGLTVGSPEPVNARLRRRTTRVARFRQTRADTTL